MKVWSAQATKSWKKMKENGKVMIMKKIFIVSAVVTAALAACQKAEVTAPSADAPVLYATIEETDATKTYMDANNNIRWSEGDQIVAFMESALGLKYQIKDEYVGATSGYFSPVSSESSGDIGAGTELSHNILYYPYSSTVRCEKSGDDYALDVVLPSAQSYAPESFGNGIFPMAAVSKSTNFAFKNILGGMKLQLKGTQIVTSITLEGKNNEKLSGVATVTAYTDETKPAITMSDGASTSVTLDCGSGVQLNESTATEFIIALPSVEFSQGFKAIITDICGNGYILETDKKNTVHRSSVLVMPAKTLGEPDIVGYSYIDEYGINHGPGVNVGGVIWAPVNCGYHARDFKYGKLYQWGRKYGVGYENTDGKDAITPGFKYGNLPMLEGQLKENEHIYFTAITTNWTIEKNDGLWNAGTEDAPVKTEYDPCPNGWRVPTYKEIQVLSGNSEMVVDELGREGYWFTAQENYSEDAPQIFFPKNGAVWTKSTTPEEYPTFKREDYATYWLSSEGEYSTYSFKFRIDVYDFKPFIGLNYLRANAMGIRCVKDDNEVIPVDKIQLNVQELTLQSGATFQLDAYVSPDNANNKRVYWYSKDKHIATVDNEGNVTAHFSGTTTITAIAGYMSSEVSVKVNGRSGDPIDYIDENNVNHGKGVLIGTAIWAPVNCGYHINDYPYGKLYQWGRKYGQGYDENDKTVPTLMNIDDSQLTMTESQSEDYENVFFYSTSGGWRSPWPNTVWNSGTEDAPIKTDYDPCPKGWRVPTKNELDSLEPTNYWTAQNNGHTEGYYQGYQYEHAPCVGFPAGGFRYGFTGEAYYRNEQGPYWSSSSVGGNAYMAHLVFRESLTLLTANFHGLSVRCVQE